MLKLLNYRLPKPRTDQKQKTVTFASKKEMEKTAAVSLAKENQGMRRIRSEKMIKWIEEDVVKVPKLASKKRIRLGSDKDEHSDHKIEGLTFSNKKVPFLPYS